MLKHLQRNAALYPCIDETRASRSAPFFRRMPQTEMVSDTPYASPDLHVLQIAGGRSHVLDNVREQRVVGGQGQVLRGRPTAMSIVIC